MFMPMFFQSNLDCPAVHFFNRYGGITAFGIVALYENEVSSVLGRASRKKNPPELSFKWASPKQNSCGSAQNGFLITIRAVFFIGIVVLFF